VPAALIKVRKPNSAKHIAFCRRRAVAFDVASDPITPPASGSHEIFLRRLSLFMMTKIFCYQLL
jgi:hypothetical protein